MCTIETTQSSPAEQRGRILLALEKYYATSTAVARGLFRCLSIDGAGTENDDEFQAHLAELSAGGYIKIFRAKDIPAYSKVADWLSPETIMFVKLLPQGYQLLASQVSSDPSVQFGHPVAMPSGADDDAERRNASRWIHERFEDDIRTVMAAAQEGNTLATEVICALVVDSLVPEVSLGTSGRRYRRQKGKDTPGDTYLLVMLKTYCGFSLAYVGSFFKYLEAVAQLDRDTLETRLIGLSQRGYVDTYSAESLPWYHGWPFLAATRPDAVMFVKLSEKGRQLIESTPITRGEI